MKVNENQLYLTTGYQLKLRNGQAIMHKDSTERYNHSHLVRVTYVAYIDANPCSLAQSDGTSVNQLTFLIEVD